MTLRVSPITFPSPAALALCAALALAGCATTKAPSLADFASDGCSMFPDGALVGKVDWCNCCVAHDLAYWRGGTAEERLQADRDLSNCVRAAAGSQVLATTMLAGVRSGGVPYFPTSYRWGYGWPYGRTYAPLSGQEEAQAARLREKYMSERPGLACGKPGTIVAATNPPAGANAVASAVGGAGKAQ
ncbi:hypothetical protein [Massilia sp. Se16.2.3]|uniref:hypothetical protein n=1 Tax=Massilia sp. Se16.2.3 TaxID=2709303 RepID=UPI00160358CA|nr:hypothetical protein [Massilia sp. Se16.2.3]